MALLQKFPEPHVDLPRRPPRHSRKMILMIVLVSAALWAILILCGYEIL
jgi:hypothetical protein